MSKSEEEPRDGPKAVPPDVTVTGAEGPARLVLVTKPESPEHVGFNLTRSRWDPYPWVKSVDAESAAWRAGLREGDCLLRVDGEDLLGLGVRDAARLVRGPRETVELAVWSGGPSADDDRDPEALACGPLPGALRRLSAVVSSVLAAMECPVCCATVRPPAAACPRGHSLCAPCRASLVACPLCRAPLAPSARNLLADQIYECVVEAFDLRGDRAGESLSASLFGERKRPAPPSEGEDEAAAFPALDGASGGGLRRGTHRLLRRLLPGRARSTGNIAGAVGSRPGPRPEERDLSRSLSNLPRGLAADSGGGARLGGRSLDDLTLAGVGAEADVLRCPFDRACAEGISGDVHEHALLAHGARVELRRSDAVDAEPGSGAPLVALLHSTGRWFYPKCERDASSGGAHVWCWMRGPAALSSRYRLDVEVRGEDGRALVGLSAPTLSLRDVSWEDALAEGRALFLGERLLTEGARVALRVRRAPEEL